MRLETFAKSRSVSALMVPAANCSLLNLSSPTFQMRSAKQKNMNLAVTVRLTQDRTYIAQSIWKDSLALSPTLAMDLYWDRMAPAWWDTIAPYHSLPKCLADHAIRGLHVIPL